MKLRVGDVVKNGGCEYVIDLVNQSRARGQPITKIPRVIHDKLNDVEKTVVVASGSKNASFSTYVDESCVVARIRKNGTRVDYARQTISPRSGPPPRRAANETEPEAGQNKQQQNEETNMSKNKAEKAERKPTAGRAKFIHSARENGKSKAEAFEAVVAKGFDCSKAAFDVIWDAKAHGAKKATKSTPPPKKSKAVSAKKATPPPRPTVTAVATVSATGTTVEPVAATAETPASLVTA